MINIKEQIGGAEWLDAKCIILIFVTLGLVLFYGKDSIRSLIAFFANSGSIIKGMVDSFKMASSLALEGKNMRCEKTNIRNNCPKIDIEGNSLSKKKKRKKIKKWDKQNCPVEAFSLPDRCTDDEYRFIGKDGNCYKNIMDADKQTGKYCSIKGKSGVPTCNKFNCPGSSSDNDMLDRTGMNKMEMEMECKKRLIEAQKDLQEEDGIIKQINVGKSKNEYKELPAHLNNCSTTPINYNSFDEKTSGKFSFLSAGKNGPPHVMRTDENTGWNHDLTLLCSEKVFNERTFYDDLDGGGWILVRRSYGQWHNATDNLYKTQSAKTSVYGDFKNSDSLSGNYSRMPPIDDYNQFLIANDEINMSGNPTKWMIINKDDLHKNSGKTLKVHSSSINKNKHDIRFNNIDKSTPHISLRGTGVNDKENMLYIENALGGKSAGKEYENVRNKGVNVFVRKYTNWTQNGTAKATQNSTGWRGYAKKAIDNNTDQRWRGNSMSHTYANRYAWWQVDLGRDYPINKIEIYGGWEPNVSWNNGNRLRFFNVSIDGDIVKQVGDKRSRVHTINISPPKKGRIVKIQFNNFYSYLMLSEVKVWGVDRNREGFTPKIERFSDKIEKEEEKEGFVSEVYGDKNPEVYNIDKQYFKYNQAEKACKYFGGTLATEDELKKAYRKGAHWCNPGWVKGGKVMYPVQRDYYNQIPKTLRDQNMCGPGPGVHEKANTPNLEYSVNCVGIKPEPDPSRIIMGVDLYKEGPKKEILNMEGVHISPYSPEKWSKTSQMSTGYKDIPPSQVNQVEIMKKQNINNTTVDNEKQNVVENFVLGNDELSEELYKAIQRNF